MTNSTSAAESAALLNELVRLLRGVSHSSRFLVIENELPQTKSLHVTIVWSKWFEVDVARRSRLIVEAYAKIGRRKDWTMTLALGLTPREAIDMGLLPITIITNRKKDDPIDGGSLRKAMTHASDGVFSRGSQGIELRFPSLERAEQVRRELHEAVPGPYWSIIQEISK